MAFLFSKTDVSVDLSTPETDEIYEDNNSAQDVCADVAGGLMMGRPIVQQQQH